MRITGAQRFDLRIGKSGLVNVFSRPHRALRGHDLPDKLLLALYELIQIAVEGVFGHIGENVHFRVFIALADDASFTLLQIRRSPGTIQMMERAKLCLHIGACAHFLRGADQHTNLTGPHFAKQFFLLSLAVCGVDIRDFFLGDTHCNELIAEVIVNIELVITVRCR